MLRCRLERRDACDACCDVCEALRARVGDDARPRRGADAAASEDDEYAVLIIRLRWLATVSSCGVESARRCSEFVALGRGCLEATWIAGSESHSESRGCFACRTVLILERKKRSCKQAADVLSTDCCSPKRP